MVDSTGRVVSLRGTNLGNWFVIEPWMLAAAEGEEAFVDQVQLMSILTERFGAAEAERLLDLYKSHWITEKDFRTVKSFGFNLIRLPLNYRQMEDDARPKTLRKDAWEWIDKAVKWANDNQIYVILDMHGAQGGQSVYDHTGQVGQNKLWTVPENQERLAWLWEQIAARYKNNPAVVAYDVVNEPYGATREQSVNLFAKVLPRIRRADPDKLVFAHGHWDNFDHFGNPAEKGWRNVGFQMHYYPGLFGNGRPTFRTHANHLENLQGVAAKVDALNVPFLVGEMNVVFSNIDAPNLMRLTFDRHASYGWMTTMWSYKVLTRSGGIGGGSWGMVTNRKPFRPVNFRTATKPQIETFFRSLSTMDIEVNEGLRRAMTARNFTWKIPPFPTPRTVAPAQDQLLGWRQVDVNSSRPGGLRQIPGGFELYGGGEDIWGTSDQFRYLHQEMKGDFELIVQVNGLEDEEQYAKAGLMVRSSLAANSPHVLLSVFSDGEMQFAHRASAGADTTALPAVRGSLPGQWLRLVRKGDSVEGFHRRSPSEPWKSIGRHPFAATDPVFAGVVSLSHNNSSLVKATYGELKIKPL